MLRIRTSSELEAIIDRATRIRLREWRQKDPHYRQRLAEALKMRPAHMTWAEFFRFRVLDRQFAGGGWFGMPHAVRVTRHVVRGAKRFVRKDDRERS